MPDTTGVFRAPRPAVRMLLSAASGLLCSAAFPPWDLGPLAFVGLTPLLVALHGVPPRRAAWLGYLWGLSFYLATVWWVVNTMTTYGRMPLALSLVALGLLAAVLAGYTGAFAWMLTVWRGRVLPPPWCVPLGAAALWTALELARTYLFSGFPWALLGYTQYRASGIRELAALTGVYGISALLVLVNATLAESLVCARGRAGWSGSARDCVLLWAVALGAIAGSVGFATQGWRDPTGGDALRVGLLQGNIDQGVKWDRRHQVATLEIYERLVRRVAAERPALIVWPETAVPFFLRREPELGPRVQRLAVEIGIPMLVGSPDLGEDGLLYNTAFLLGADGSLLGRYDKRHLVPFGEYVPLQQVFFFLDKLVVGIGDFGRGRSATVFAHDAVPFSAMICYEAIFPAEVREFTQAGAQFLVHITNDAWFGRSGAPQQHLAMAAMRAVENGMYLVRAANTGITAVVAPSGRIVAETPLLTEAALVATIYPRQTRTPYSRVGDVFPWACLICFAASGLLPRLRRRAGSYRVTP